jgi:putative transposase
MKYLPVFPDRFASLAHARQFLDEFMHAGSVRNSV